MLTEILNLLSQRNQASVKFTPEIKIKRENDIVYINDIKKIRNDFFATVETYKTNGPNDKAVFKIAGLDKLCLQGILIRLKGMAKPVTGLMLLLVVSLCSCTHQVYLVQQVVPTSHGLIYIGKPEKFTPNGDTIPILFQATTFGKTKAH